MQRRREAVWRGGALATVSLALLLAGCFGKDPLEGSWELSGGARLTFGSRTAKLEAAGIDPIYGGQAGMHWEAPWRRVGNETLILGPPPSHPSLSERRFHIVKLNGKELVLKALDDQSLITGQKVETS